MRKLKWLLVTVVFGLVFTHPMGVLAADEVPTSGADPCTKQGVLPDLYKNLRVSEDGNACTVKFDELGDVGILLANVIQILLALAGLVAVGMLIFAGFMYVTSNGDSSKVARAKDTIVNVLVFGLPMVILAYAAVGFVAESFTR